MKHSRTDTTIFLLPLMFGKEDVITPDFKNAYIRNDSFIHEDLIVLVYEKPNPNLQKYSPFAMTYEGSNAIYFFKLNETISEVRLLFFEGKYSEFSPAYKDTILNFWNVDKYSMLYNILYKLDPIRCLSIRNSRIYRKADVWPKPNLEYETLNLRSFKSYA